MQERQLNRGIKPELLSQDGPERRSPTVVAFRPAGRAIAIGEHDESLSMREWKTGWILLHEAWPHPYTELNDSVGVKDVRTVIRSINHKISPHTGGLQLIIPEKGHARIAQPSDGISIFIDNTAKGGEVSKEELRERLRSYKPDLEILSLADLLRATGRVATTASPFIERAASEITGRSQPFPLSRKEFEELGEAIGWPIGRNVERGRRGARKRWKNQDEQTGATRKSRKRKEREVSYDPGVATYYAIYPKPFYGFADIRRAAGLEAKHFRVNPHVRERARALGIETPEKGQIAVPLEIAVRLSEEILPSGSGPVVKKEWDPNYSREKKRLRDKVRRYIDYHPKQAYTTADVLAATGRTARTAILSRRIRNSAMQHGVAEVGHLNLSQEAFIEVCMDIGPANPRLSQNAKRRKTQTQKKQRVRGKENDNVGRLIGSGFDLESGIIFQEDNLAEIGPSSSFSAMHEYALGILLRAQSSREVLETYGVHIQNFQRAVIDRVVAVARESWDHMGKPDLDSIVFPQLREKLLLFSREEIRGKIIGQSSENGQRLFSLMPRLPSERFRSFVNDLIDRYLESA